MSAEQIKGGTSKGETKYAESDAEVDKGEGVDIDSNAVEKKGGATLTSVAGDLIGSMPDVSEETVLAAANDAEKDREKTKSFGHLIDRSGDSFDPAKHQTNDDGTPKTGTGGKLLKRRGRKKGGHNGTVSRSTIGGQHTQDSGHDAEKESQRAAAYTSGTAAANLVFSVGIALGGEEWQPAKDAQHGVDEQKQLTAAFGEYFLATGNTDIPPGIALTITLGAYALPRFTMPKTQTRAKSLWEKIKAWRMNRKADKALAKDHK